MILAGPGRRALVIDDHPLYREALVEALQRHPVRLVVDGVSSAEPARLAQARHGPYALVVADQLLPDGHGIDLLCELCWQGSARVLMSGSSEPALSMRARRLGLQAFLPKTLAPQHMLEVLARVLAGGEWFHHPDEANPALLTERQCAVLRLAAQGLSNRSIGEALGVGERTVKDHMGQVFLRLEVANRAQAVARGAELGLL